MQLIDGQPVYSATDLVGFLACAYLTDLERAALAGLVQRPKRVDPELDRIAKRGHQHEQRFLADLQARGLRVIQIQPDGSVTDAGERLRQAATATLDAMRRGDDVIYQATFFDGRWRGHADFLRRVDAPDAPSTLGPWHYEAWDTKLARHVKGSAVLQLCVYSDLVAVAQGRRPEWMHVALGGSAREVVDLRVSDYAAYHRQVSRLFDEHASRPTPAYPPRDSRPDPVEHCEVCRWSLECAARRRREDDLSLVAGITARQRRALRARGVETRTALAGLPIPLDPALEGTSADALKRVLEQARIQVQGERRGRVLYELLDPSRLKDETLEPDRGLLSLPGPSPGDLFFDIEGDPFALDDGVDYLFGVIEPGLLDADGQATYHQVWARDERGEVTWEAEKRAFEALIDLFSDRLRADPDLHIYHYASYEPAAVGRLMGRHATREDEVDALLRGGVFVDLFRAVRQGLRASVESYSIKKMEPLYGFERTIDLRDAGSSIVAFETWLELEGEAGSRDETILERIAGYNRDDCESNWRLRDWLEGRREELARQLGTTADDLSRPVPKEGGPAEELTEALARVQEVADRLTAGVPADPRERTPEEHARWLLAQLLSWHRREDKAAWWRYFHLLEDLTDEDRIHEPDALGGLEYARIVRQEARSFVHRYRFPPQEHAIEPGAQVVDPATKRSPGTVVAVDNADGTIDLKRGVTSDVPHPTSLIPHEIIGTTHQRESLLRLGTWVAEHGIDADGPYRAARDLLMRRPTRARAPVGGSLVDGEPLAHPGEHSADAARRLVRSLDASCLAIQGPPGSGKTTTGAEMIVDLVTAGKRVGVTANSHKVIGNLLDKVATAAARRGVPVRIGQKPANGERPTCRAARCLVSIETLLHALGASEPSETGVDVAGATGWAWSRGEFEGSLDVLVVDEAGQMSLANVVAIAPAARDLVLLGDPQQLDQPRQGSHPPGAERSALGHLLDERATMPNELGLLLEDTWRLHPDLCAFTSEVFYEGRLGSRPVTWGQRLTGRPPLDGTGIRFVPVEHAGNVNSSPEEAATVAQLVADLLKSGATWIGPDGREAPVGLDDVLVITPYNAQVREIAGALDDAGAARARVGTVDKFQGQEAPVSIYSMATSTPEEAPRGMEFLYSLHRLNVATSRARCLAAVIASPELIRVRCRTPRQMQLANALCRAIEMAGGEWSRPGREA